MSETRIEVTPVNGQVIVWQAKELDRKPPKSINVNGMLNAPYEFIRTKTANFDAAEATFYINISRGWVELRLEERDPYAQHTIIGELTMSDESKEIGCNTKTYTVGSLRNFIQFHPQYFEAKMRQELLRQLYNFKGNFTAAIENAADMKAGNRKMLLEKKAGELDLTKKFQMSFPLLKGKSASIWNIELFLQVNNDELEISLYCEDLLLREQQVKTEEIEKLQKLMEETFPCSQVILG